MVRRAKSTLTRQAAILFKTKLGGYQKMGACLIYAKDKSVMFSYALALRADFPELATAVLRVQGIGPACDAAPIVAGLTALAAQRIAGGSEADLPEIVAWRRTFSRMGLKPTQYRCASEALLRRLRKEGALPPTHPFIDLCNATSVAFAIPIAAFDPNRIAGGLVARRAVGTERYETFSGEVEQPEAGEVIFADDESRSHARRWTNRQSGYSAVSAATQSAVVVAEAMHSTGQADLVRLTDSLIQSIKHLWPKASIEKVSVQ